MVYFQQNGAQANRPSARP